MPRQIKKQRRFLPLFASLLEREVTLSKKSVINRNNKREKVINHYLTKRQEILSTLNDPKIDQIEKTLARQKLQKLPRDSSPVRYRNRCSMTGRPRGVFKKFGLCRIKLRDIAMSGQIPGITKASW